MAQHLGWDEARINQRLLELADLVRLPHDAIDRYPPSCPAANGSGSA